MIVSLRQSAKMKRHSMKCLILTILCFFILPVSAHALEKLYEMKTSEGITVQLPVTDAGPIPTENKVAKIEVAGFGILKQNNKPLLYWSFGLTLKEDKMLKLIRVSDVTPESETIVLINDDTPIIEKNYWEKSLEPKEINRENFPWLYQAKPTIKLFKFTIELEGQQTELYQLAWYSRQAKAKVIQYIKKNSGG